MKRLLITLLGVFTLISCANNEVMPEKSWPEEQASIMKEHLYGEILPFLDKEDLKVDYNNDFKELTISGGLIENDDLVKYAAKYTANDGWKGGDVSQSYRHEEGTVFEFEKMVMTSEGKRFVNVFFSAYQEGIYSKTGEFFLSAVDPYLYVYPVEEIKTLAKGYFDSDVVIPAIEGEYYEFSYSGAYISVYFDSDKSDGGYSEILLANNWIIEEELVDNFYFATSPDHKYVIRYKYLDKYSALDIYFDTVKVFPSGLIDDFFNKYGVHDIFIPALEGASGYVFYTNPKNDYYVEIGYPENISASIYCYDVSEKDKDDYLTELKGLKWEISSNKATYYLDNAIYSIEVDYKEAGRVIIIDISGFLEPIGEKAWPYSRISALLPSGLTDYVPPFEGDAIGYDILNDAWGTAVYVQVAKGTENACVESYKETLLKHGYTFAYKDTLGDSYYISPNDELVVGVYFATSGSITIPFEIAKVYD